MPKLAKVLGIGVMPLFYKSSASIASTCWIPTNVSQKRVLVHKLYHVCIFFNPNWCGEAYYEVLTDIFFSSLVNLVSPIKSQWGLWYGACSQVLDAVPLGTTQKRSRFKGFLYYGPTFLRLPRYMLFIPRYVACTSLFALSRGVECGEVLFSHTLHVIPCDFCI